jgi:putative transposase
VAYLCDWLNVSRGGYYAWRNRPESHRAKADRQLLQEITQIHRESRGTYGSPRVHETLKRQGIAVGKKRVERLMRTGNLQGRVVKVTRRQPGLKGFLARGENLTLEAPPTTAINQIWVSDITYLKVRERWVLLIVIMDRHSRRILGWSLSRTRTVDDTLRVLKRVIKQRQVLCDVIFHTDRGIEYTGFRFQDVLKQHGLLRSVNRLGMCTDNAHMESFFHTLKAELTRGRAFRSEKELRLALNSYINQFYNHKRLHSGIGYCTPAEYENMAA